MKARAAGPDRQSNRNCSQWLFRRARRSLRTCSISRSRHNKMMVNLALKKIMLAPAMVMLRRMSRTLRKKSKKSCSGMRMMHNRTTLASWRCTCRMRNPRSARIVSLSVAEFSNLHRKSIPIISSCSLQINRTGKKTRSKTTRCQCNQEGEKIQSHKV